MTTTAGTHAFSPKAGVTIPTRQRIARVVTLAVAFPSLYVFSALADSRLTFANTLRLMLAAVVVDLALLASLGPVTGFFALSTESYRFMIVLNVVFFGFLNR